VFAAINLQHYFSDLTNASWSIIPVELKITEELLQTAKKKESLFKKAGINHTESQVSRIRSDQIYWLDTKNELDTCERRALKDLTYLQEELKNYFRAPVKEFECHYSIYEKGQFYARHRDTLKVNNKRIFSFVLYLNPSWSEADGGQIVGYENDRVLFKVQPLAGQLLLFKSELEHEVLPVQRTRYALTGWMRS
jgi:SM-20-related protein